ncbi:MAG: hypothetical protein ACLR13_08820 [Acutalibacteraceae bacterium]
MVWKSDYKDYLVYSYAELIGIDFDDTVCPKFGGYGVYFYFLAVSAIVMRI